MGNKPKFINADCVHALAEMSASSVDSCIVDPPYGLGIHGLEWDTDVFNASVWSQVLRVAKPGCHLLAFGSTRKFHRLVTSIEDSGWEIRDTLGWIYATGLPKNFNISKGIDKFRRRDFIEAATKMGIQIPGNSLHDWTKSTHAPSDKWWAEFKKFITPKQWISVERKVIGTRNKGKAIFGSCDGEYEITESKHPDARRWDGFGTALKPCWEPISLARKPVEGSVVMNVLDHGTGGLNIDGCRFDGKFPTNIVNDGDTGIFTENVSRLEEGKKMKNDISLTDEQSKTILLRIVQEQLQNKGSEPNFAERLPGLKSSLAKTSESFKTSRFYKKKKEDA